MKKKKRHENLISHLISHFISQKLVRIVKKKENNSINNSKGRKGKLALSCSKKLSTILRGIKSKHHGSFFAWIVFIKLNLLKKYVKIRIYVEL